MSTHDSMRDIALDAAESLPDAFAVLVFVFHGEASQPDVKIYHANCAHTPQEMPSFLTAMAMHYQQVVDSLGPKNNHPPKPEPPALFIPGPRPLFIPPR